LTQTPIRYGTLTTGKNYYRKKRYSHLAGYVFQQVQITTGKNYDPKKKVQSSSRRLKLISDYRLSCQNTNTNYYKTGKKLQPEKKVKSSGRRLEHKTQNTRHTDTTTNKMSRATLPSSIFAPSFSMGRDVAPPNHGATAPQRHAQAVSQQGCAHCCWFSCLGRQNKRHRIGERGGCLGLRWLPLYQYKQQSNGRQ
jgi:hypothetical protein